MSTELPPRFSMKVALAFLATPTAPRVFSPAELAEGLRATGVPLDERSATMKRLLHALQDATLVTKVSRGLYLNRRAAPPPGLDEAAPRIRAGAVVSLQTVLGRWGVLNNPVSHVSCVMPGAKVGRVPTLAGVFEFYSMREDLISRPQDRDWESLALTRGPVPTASPAKALLDWLWLSSHPASRLSPPPRHDIDLDALDTDTLAWLADRMGLTQRLSDFRDGTPLVVVSPRQRLSR